MQATARIMMALVALSSGLLVAGESPDCTTSPAVILAVAPAFPDLPWKARIGADQWVQVQVSEAGDVGQATMETEMNPSLGFGKAAVAAAQRWKFAAAVGCPSRKARLLFRFVMPVSKPQEAGVQFRPPYEIDIAVLAISVDTRSTAGGRSSNSAVSPSHSGVTLLANSSKQRAAGRAGYRWR